MSNFNGAPNANQRKKTILSDYRQPHPCTDEPMPGGKYPAQIMWDQKNNGEIVLKISDGIFGEAKSNHKEVTMDYAHRGILFEAILEAASDPNFTQKSIAVRWKAFVFQGGQGRMSDQPILQCNFIVARDPNGWVTLGYVKGDYKVPVRFKGPKDSVVYIKGPDGNRTEDTGTMSRWAARSWVNFHRPILDRMEQDGWTPPKPKGGNANGNNNGGGNNYNNNRPQGNNNGGGNNYNQGNNGNGGGNSAPAPVDDFDGIDF